eukprot:5662761-Karenia_brevis.AAC.1
MASSSDFAEAGQHFVAVDPLNKQKASVALFESGSSFVKELSKSLASLSDSLASMEGSANVVLHFDHLCTACSQAKGLCKSWRVWAGIRAVRAQLHTSTCV